VRSIVWALIPFMMFCYTEANSASIWLIFVRWLTQLAANAVRQLDRCASRAYRYAELVRDGSSTFTFGRQWGCHGSLKRAGHWKNFLGYMDKHTGCANKEQSLRKNSFPSCCNRFFHQIHRFQWWGFAPHTQQFSSQYLLWFKNYKHLNLKVQF